MNVDVQRLKTDSAYRTMVRKSNARAFFIVGTAYLVGMLLFVLHGALTYIAEWAAIVGLTVFGAALLTMQNPLTTLRGFALLYRDGFRALRPDR